MEASLQTTQDDNINLNEPLLLGDSNVEGGSGGVGTVEEEDVGDDNDKDIVLTCCSLLCCCCCNEERTTIRVNHNVFLNLIVALLYGISNSLWNGTAYAAYIKHLGHDKNGPVGNIEAVNGLASLLTALPVGYIADKIGRSKVISFGGILLLITSILQIGVLEWVGSTNDNNNNVEDSNHNNNREQQTTLIVMGVIMAFWGVGDGIVNGPASALYADSTPEGQRSVYYNYLFGTYMVASSVGPLVSIILFQTLGDVWDMKDLRIVIYVGLGIEIINSFLMMMFDDKKALDESSSSGGDGNNDNSHQETSPCIPNSNSDTTIPSSNLAREDEEEEEEIGQEEEQQQQQQQQQQQGSSFYNQRWIPYIIFIQGLIFAIGSGMTVKFFPLFFKDQVGMSPSQVQIVYTAVPFVMVITSTLGSKLASSGGFGRVQTTLLFSCLGVSLLFCMVIFKQYLDTHPFVLVPVYVFRTSLMNASYPLTQSILMDFVPKDERARWKSLDSVTMFGWCGSAALGGMVADRYDYTYTFLITAIIQSIGTAVWALLLPLVPRKEGSSVEGDEQGHAQDGTTQGNTSSLLVLEEDPLLDTE